ncbi:phage portal protein [Malikia spinosa]|uniref:phage portal protein n=1 Tax=Malikia spinosa TaxID=86180 RepID=UPI000A5DD71D
MAKRKSRHLLTVSASRPGGAGGLAGASMAAHTAAGNSLALANWNPVRGSADADTLIDLDTLTARSRDLARNNGLMAGGMQTLRDNIVGATLRLSATPDYRLLGWTREQAREWGNQTESKFRTWAETNECDASRTLNLLGLTLQALGGTMLNGDALALPLWLPRPGLKWNTRLLMVESDRLCTPQELTHRDDIRGGIEFDVYGAPMAYCVLKHHPGDWISTRSGYQDWERIPAYTAWGRRRVLHLHDKERTGQSRGKPVVASVMTEFHMAGKYASNELQASLANSLVAAFLESDLDPTSAAEIFGTDVGAAWKDFVRRKPTVRQMEGAAILPLPPGAKLNSFTPGRPNAAFEAFMLASLRNIAAGMNMPYELLLKDFSKTNYSSARAALLEAWRYFNGRRRWLTDYWLREVYLLWLEEAINAGEIDAPGFYDNRYAYARCRFIFGGRGWVDPVKDATASKIRRESQVSTLEQECAEQGLDYEEVLDQLAIERQMMLARGLNPDAASPVAVAAASAPSSPDEASDPEDGTDPQDGADQEPPQDPAA